MKQGDSAQMAGAEQKSTGSSAESKPRGLIEESKRRFMIKKSVDQILTEAEKGEMRLKRTLNAIDVSAVGIGAIIGAGIFVLTGVAAARFAGPSVTLSFIIAGIACSFAALCYAEFASMIPVAGSAYTYSYATMGELVAWMIGWDLLLEYSMGGIAVSIGWSGYIVELAEAGGVHIPVALSNGPFVEGGMVNLPAVAIILFLTMILILGSKESSRLNIIIVVIKVIVLIFIIVVGARYIDWSNFSPYFPYGIGGTFAGASIIFFAYIGFDSVSTMAEEVKNPGRDMPTGIIASLLVATVLYILASLILVGMVPFYELAVPAPFALAFNYHGLSWAAGLISIGAIAGITSVLLVSLLAQPRIMFALARDGLIPKGIAKVHPRFGTPYIATIITGSIVAICAAFLPISVTAELVNIGTLFAFVLVCAGIILLRRSSPNAKRPFKVPLYPYTPILGAILSLMLMTFLPPPTWYRFLIWMGLGLIVYANYGYHKSKLLKKL